MKNVEVRKFIGIFPLHTPRTLIRLINKRDCKWYSEEIQKEYYTEYSDNKKIRYIDNNILRDRLYKLIEDIRQNDRFIYELRAAAVYKDTNKVCGGLALHPTTEPGVIELSYWIKPEYQGNGLATEIVSGIIQSLLDIDAIDEIRIVIQSVNTASIKVAEHCGAFLYKKEKGRYYINLVYVVRRQ